MKYKRNLFLANLYAGLETKLEVFDMILKDSITIYYISVSNSDMLEFESRPEVLVPK